MGNVCQNPPEQALEVVNMAGMKKSRPQDYDPAEKSNFSNQKPPSQHQSNVKESSRMSQDRNTALPQVRQKVRQVIETECEGRPLAGAPLDLNSAPEYLKEQQAFYVGTWLSEQPHGKGAIYFQSGAYFEGELREGEVDCSDGLLVLPDGSFYRGQFRNSLFEGKGTFKSSAGTTYHGDWQQGVPQGKGEQRFSDGNIYEGSFSNGVKSGFGSFKWSDGRVYEGQFRSGMMNGRGKFYRQDKEYFEGQFENNKKVGKNKLKTEFGTYTGSFQDGQIVGEGTFEWNDQTVFEGQFKNGLPHGAGLLRLPQGKVFNGFWEEGKNKKIREVNRERSRSRSRSRSKVSNKDD